MPTSGLCALCRCRHKPHSVRGFLSGPLGKKMGIAVNSVKREDALESTAAVSQVTVGDRYISFRPPANYLNQMAIMRILSDTEIDRFSPPLPERNMKIAIYSRVSTSDQNTAMHADALRKYGAELCLVSRERGSGGRLRCKAPPVVRTAPAGRPSPADRCRAGVAPRSLGPVRRQASCHQSAFAVSGALGAQTVLEGSGPRA
jgi:hypothetical protein